MNPNEENMIVVPMIERMEIIMSIQVCLIHEWTLILRRTMERKAFLVNPENQYCVSQWGEHNCNANGWKNGGYSEYPSLSHFTNEL